MLVGCSVCRGAYLYVRACVLVHQYVGWLRGVVCGVWCGVVWWGGVWWGVVGCGGVEVL